MLSYSASPPVGLLRVILRQLHQQRKLPALGQVQMTSHPCWRL